MLLAVAICHCVPQPAEFLQVQPTPKHLTAPLTVTCCPLPTHPVPPLGQSQGAHQRSLRGGREELSFQRRLLLHMMSLLCKTPTVHWQEKCYLHLTLPFEKISSQSSWTQSSLPGRLLRPNDTLLLMLAIMLIQHAA